MILDLYDDSEDESYENESCKKVTKNIHAYFLFQIMVNTLNNGKVKTPLHVLTGRQFTPVVVVEVLLQAKLEFQSAMMFEGPVHCLLLMPFKMQERKQFDASHFGTGSQAGFVSGAFDNMDMKDKSSASGTKTTEYCAVVLFQDGTEKVTRKPDKLDAEKISQRLTEALSCK